jgi:hypothetical protein
LWSASTTSESVDNALRLGFEAREVYWFGGSLWAITGGDTLLVTKYRPEHQWSYPV